VFQIKLRRLVLAVATAALTLSTSITPVTMAATSPAPAETVQVIEFPGGLATTDIAVRATGACCSQTAREYHFVIENKGDEKMSFHIHQRINFINPQTLHQPTWDQTDSRILNPGDSLPYHLVCSPPAGHICGSATIFLKNFKGLDTDQSNNIAVMH
jgi:hypothetical protein